MHKDHPQFKICLENISKKLFLKYRVLKDSLFTPFALDIKSKLKS